MTSKLIGILFGTLALVVLTVAPSAFAATTQVEITSGAGADQSCVTANNCFSPDEVHINTGDTVTWTNSDTVSHTVTSGKPSDNQPGTDFDSSLITAGKTFSFTFKNPGTFTYFCMVHPWMTGEVVVGGSAASTSSGGSGTTAQSNVGMSDNMQVQSTAAPTNTQTNQAAPATNSAPSTAATTAPSSAPAETSANTQPDQSSAPAETSANTQPDQSSAPAETSANTQPDQSSGVSSFYNSADYTDADNPHGPMESIGWGGGIAALAIMSGVGVWTAVRHR